MDLKIDCLGPWFTDHSQTAPPAAAAALKRGTLNACFKLQIDLVDNESQLPAEIAIMKSCGMVVISEEDMDMGFIGISKFITLELGWSSPEEISAMWDVRRSADLPFQPAQLSSNARQVEDESYLEHALQQQAWHAEFMYQKVGEYCDLDVPGLLRVN